MGYQPGSAGNLARIDTVVRREIEHHVVETQQQGDISKIHQRQSGDGTAPRCGGGQEGGD